jgi:hypothetical protein
VNFQHLAKVYLAAHPRVKAIVTAEPASSVPEEIKTFLASLARRKPEEHP